MFFGGRQKGILHIIKKSHGTALDVLRFLLQFEEEMRVWRIIGRRKQETVAAGNEFHVNNIFQDVDRDNSKPSGQHIGNTGISAHRLSLVLCQLIGMPKISLSMISSIILSAGCERYRDGGIFQQPMTLDASLWGLCKEAVFFLCYLMPSWWQLKSTTSQIIGSTKESNPQNDGTGTNFFISSCTTTSFLSSI